MKAIFTFHAIDEQDAVLSYAPALLDYLLRVLAQKNVPVVTLDGLLDPATDTGVALTFDDGMHCVHENALPILKKHGACAHVYVTSDLIGSKELWPAEPSVGQYTMMDWGQIADLQAANILIEAHTRTHPDVRQLSAEQLEAECEASDACIESMTGRRPVHFAYPFGYHNAAVREFVAQRYQSAVTTELAYFDESCHRTAMPRLDSYYFQSRKSIDRLGGWLSRRQVAVRSLLRDVRKSQCRANCQ